MIYKDLIDSTALNSHLGQNNWVVMDCRFSLVDPKAGRHAYEQSHLPGARYAHLNDDLSDPMTPTTGRHPLPDPARLARQLGEWGIGNDTQVIAYDDMGGMLAAARLWWLLRWLGHQAVAVLNGGFPAWQKASLPVTAELPTVQPATFEPRLDSQSWLTTAQVIGLPDTDLLIDARGAARYRGEMEPIDPVAGHIPGAINLPTEENLTADGYFRPASELRARFDAILDGRSPAQIVHQCGSGVTACHNLLAMEVAGLHGARLYAGSWSEWIRDSSRPISTGSR